MGGCVEEIGDWGLRLRLWGVVWCGVVRWKRGVDIDIVDLFIWYG